jgi:uncharacterized membrane protein
MNETTVKVIKKFLQFKVEEIWDCIKTTGLVVLIAVICVLCIFFMVIIALTMEYLINTYDWAFITARYIGCVIIPAIVVFGVIVLLQIWITENWNRARRAVKYEKRK